MPTSLSEHRVTQYITRHLGGSEPGEPLPSFRQVMQGCKVGPQTVAAVVKRFEKQGLIEVRINRGLYKSAKVTKDWLGVKEIHVVGFGVGFDPNNRGFYNDELQCRLGEQLTAQRLGLKMHRLSPKDTEKDVERWIATHNCSACLTLAINREDIASIFRDNYIPVVNMFPATASAPPNSIVIDPGDVVSAQIEHLVKLGHQRIGYLHNVEIEKFHRDLFFRREAFYRIVAERRLPMEPHWVQFGGYSAESVTAAMEQMLSGPEKPTAVIAADHQISVIYHVLSKHGLCAGIDFSVVGTDDLPIAAMVHPPATTLRVPRLGAVKIALAMLKKLIKGEEVESVQNLPVRLIERDSTCPPKRQDMPKMDLNEGGAYE